METDRDEQNRHAKLEKPFVITDLDQIYLVITGYSAGNKKSLRYNWNFVISEFVITGFNCV